MMSTPSAPPSDPNASYLHANPAQPQLSQPLQTAAAGHNATLAALANGSNDPVVRYTVERAMAEVRSADRRTRHLMMIEIAAKQLALQIIEYEELAGGGSGGGGGGAVVGGHVGNVANGQVVQQMQQGQNGGQDGNGNGAS
jgi:hypothetical protein